MSWVTTMWSVHLKGLRRSWQEDGRVRLTWFLRALFFGGVGFSLVHRWSLAVVNWQAGGTADLQNRLLLLCLGMAAPLVVLAGLETIHHGFAREEAQLLQTLPLPFAHHFRVLVARLFFEVMGSWLLFGAVVTGLSLVAGMGWRGVGWAFLALFSMAAAICLGLAAAPILIHMTSGRPKEAVIPLLGIAGAVGLWGGVAAGARVLGPGLYPYVPAVAWAVMVGVSLGPLAHQLGRLYVHAFLLLQEGARVSRRSQRQRQRLSYLVRGWLGQRRGLYSALLVKGLLSQSRNPFFIIRALVLVIAALLFPRVHQTLAAYGYPSALVTIGYVLLVTSVVVNEVVVNAVAGEGERLTIYLIAPLNPAVYLRDRYLVCLLPVLTSGLALAMTAAGQAGFSLREMSLVIFVVLLSLMASTGLLVWGGTWDADGDAVVESPTQILMQEEAPVRPRRFMLLNLSILYQGLVVSLVALLPPVAALAVNGLMTVLVLAGAWRLGMAHLRRLLLPDSLGKVNQSGPLPTPRRG